jgi:hypothetical protein
MARTPANFTASSSNANLLVNLYVTSPVDNSSPVSNFTVTPSSKTFDLKARPAAGQVFPRSR